MSDWADAVRARGVAEVAAAFDMKVDLRRHSAGPCPACKAPRRHPKRQDTRGALGLRPDLRGFECFECGAKGDAVTLAALAVQGEEPTSKAGWRPIAAACAARGLCEPLDGAHGPSTASTAPRRPAPLEKPAEAPRRPPEAQVLDLWQRCRPITDDAQVREWIESRGLDAGMVAELDLCRALPVSGDLPRWARYMLRSWRESSHRVIVPLYGAGGRMESLHARALAPASAKDKAASPAGDKAGPLEVRGLVMADEGARNLLAGEMQAGRVIVAEGVPDFLTWATRYGDAAENVPAVFGIIAGSWTPEIAATIPNGSRVTIRTHHDEAGHKYAAKIHGTLEGRVTLLRSKAPENAGT